MAGKRYSAACHALLAATLLLSGAAAGAAENPFAAFKLLGEQTNCVADGLTGRDASADRRDAAAETAYRCARAQMDAAYQLSELESIKNYQSWEKFSTRPYRSATHGNRYVNNYANTIASADYGLYEQAGELPEGSILAKDSFFVDEQGRVFVGPLSLMEKMYPGFKPAMSDWRYTLILPDGFMLRSTGAVHSASVTFCGECHRAVSAQDLLFFVPERYRLRRPDPQAQ